MRVVTYYGTDNPIDGVILDVLIRKHKSIKSDLGVTVAVPGSSEQIAEALFEGALFRERARSGAAQMSLDFIEDLGPKKKAIHAEWESARDREKASRSRFAQHTLSPEAVAAELRERTGRDRPQRGCRALLPRRAPGGQRASAVKAQGRDCSGEQRNSSGTPPGHWHATNHSRAASTCRLRRTNCTWAEPVRSSKDSLAGRSTRRSIPWPATTGQWLPGAASSLRRRSAVRTVLIVARFRYHLQVAAAATETILCEEIVPLACTGAADSPQWLPRDEAERLLLARPDRNLIQSAIDQQLSWLLPSLPVFQRSLAAMATERANAQLAAHERVREASRTKGRVTVRPLTPVDVLGAYVLLPKLP